MSSNHRERGSAFAVLVASVSLSACAGDEPNGEAWETAASSTTSPADGSGSSGFVDDTSGEPETDTEGPLDDTGSTGDPMEPEPDGPVRYPAGQTHSPITPYVANHLHDIVEQGDGYDDVFMKIGASSTVSSNTLHCFVDDPIELGEHDHLQSTLDFFLAGDAAGTTPFDRETEAARVGHHAGWAISGDPSPIELERTMISPALALVHWGTNDMGWGETYGDALNYFHDNMTVMLDGLIEQGVVPIVFGITRRGDLSSAQRWVQAWNTALRGIAQSRQVPFVDMYHAIDPLRGHGLAGDGLHLEAYPGGACVLDEMGLQHGYNIRNLIALEVLDRTVQVLIDDEPGVDPPMEPMAGTGTSRDPWVIESLPFNDVQNTAVMGESMVDVYAPCDDADESGPELWYRFEVEETTAIRALVLDEDGTDVDLHLVDESATGDGCIARGHHRIETTVEPGVYHFAVDTWADDGVPLSGEFVFVVVECDPGDSSCN